MVEVAFTYLSLVILAAYLGLAMVNVVGASLYDAVRLRRQKPNKKRLPYISVIVVTQNHAAYISECLHSVLNNDYKKYELIVVDNVSQDDTKAIVKQVLNARPAAPVTFVRKRKAGSFDKIAAKAAASVKGDIILPIDGDSRLASGALRAVAERFRADKELDTLMLNERVKVSTSLFGLLERFKSLGRSYRLKRKALFGGRTAYESNAMVLVQPSVKLGDFVRHFSGKAIQPLKLLEPFVLGYFFYIAYVLQDARLVMISVLGLVMWLGFCVWSAEQMRWQEKLGLVLALPTACLLFALRSLVLPFMYVGRFVYRQNL